MDKTYRYIEKHSIQENEALLWIRKQTNLRTNHARMLSGPVQGAFLTMLVRSCGVRRALELGTFTGYASTCIAMGLPDDGHLDTLEINDELNDLIIEGWQRAGVSGKITLHIGDALETIKRFVPASRMEDSSYDFAYIDANKRDYCAYFDAILPLMRHGSLILADNTLWDGKILEDPLPVDAQTREIFRFNEKVASDTRVETVILPLRDGLTLMRVL